MRKMGFENMRSGSSRYSNILFALIIVCFFLTYNWWSLSTQNYELLKQMDDMGEQLRVCSDERVSCINRKNSMDSQLRESESQMADIKMSELKLTDTVEKQKSDYIELSKTLDKVKDELKSCQYRVESVTNLNNNSSSILKAIKIEKDMLATQLVEAREKISQLEISMKSMKQTTAANNVYKSAPDFLAKQHTVSPLPKPKGKEDENNIKIFQHDLDNNIQNEPIQDGNHALEEPSENAANEELDDTQDTLKKP